DPPACESMQPTDPSTGESMTALRRDVCCRKNMLWATSLDRSVSEGAFARALEQLGFVRAAGASPIAGLSMFDHGATGHRVIHVARTGRIQIRLDPLTSHEDRSRAAEQIYELLRAACRAACQSSDSAAVAGNASGA
ncbi:MAG TPA: hypothetical protein VNM90_11430, partial [Haliangium sp.]|nr:hypothetical protein [Haliangium sp.]